MAAAPSGGAIVSAFAGDAAIVIGLASRAVGHVSLLYGYDPEEPIEKLFVMSVVNAGTAASVGAKNAAFADISRLTQALIRGKTWKVLNDSIVTQVAGRFAEAVGHTLTQKGLGKVVPIAGILIGGTLNWTTLEGIVDTADMADPTWAESGIRELVPGCGAGPCRQVAPQLGVGRRATLTRLGQRIVTPAASRDHHILVSVADGRLGERALARTGWPSNVNQCSLPHCVRSVMPPYGFLVFWIAE